MVLTRGALLLAVRPAGPADGGRAAGGRCVKGALLITAAELMVGLFFNRLLGFTIWDYSDKPFNLYGQICPLYTIYWYFLCYPAFWLLRLLRGGGNPGHRQFTQKSAYKRDCKRAANRV